MKTVGDFWNHIDTLLVPFPRNNQMNINESPNTQQLIIKDDFPQDTTDRTILVNMIERIQDAIADYKDYYLHVRVYPEIVQEGDRKYFYCRLQYIPKEAR